VREGGRERGREGGATHLVVKHPQGDEVGALGEDRNAVNLEVEREALRAGHGLLHQAHCTDTHVLHLREGGREGGREAKVSGRMRPAFGRFFHSF